MQSTHSYITQIYTNILIYTKEQLYTAIASITMQIAVVVDMSKFAMRHSFASKQLKIHLETDQEI